MMRVFQDQLLASSSTIQLDESASHHLARVLRAKIGDEIFVFNGSGGEYRGIIREIVKKNIIVQLKDFCPRSAESPLELWLAQGISRGEKMDYTIQKAVELGVKKIIPLLTERCTVKLDTERRDKRWQHWRAVMISACEQCGRVEIPELSVPLFLTDWHQEKNTIGAGFVLDPKSKNSIKGAQIDQSKPIVLLIGPEGGLTREEIDEACKNKFTPLNLGPRILRTETAGMAVMSILQGLFGDMG